MYSVGCAYCWPFSVKELVSIMTILLIPTKIEKEYPILLFWWQELPFVSFIAGLVVLSKIIRISRRNQWLPDADRDFLNDVVMELEADLKNSKHKGPFVCGDW